MNSQEEGRDRGRAKERLRQEGRAGKEAGRNYKGAVGVHRGCKEVSSIQNIRLGNEASWKALLAARSPGIRKQPASLGYAATALQEGWEEKAYLRCCVLYENTEEEFP